MKLKLLWLILGVVTLANGATLDSPTQFPGDLKPEYYEAHAARLAAELLSRYHYKRLPMDKALSERTFDHYLKALDAEKLFLVQADVDHFSIERGKLADAILAEDLSIPFAMFNLYEHRVTERLTFAKTLLQQPFDFSVNESLEDHRDKTAWAQSESDIREIWRKRVKNDWLRLKLAGKDESGIAEILDKRYEHSIKRLSKVKSTDAFETFMNAFTTSIEPHTNYMGPHAAQEFDIAMRLSLVGIGAALAESDEYTTIGELIVGGPAILSGQLSVGDRIVGIGQGKDGPITDILGWRQDDAVTLIRGSADSIVRLDVLPVKAGPDGKHKLVTLVRKPINLQEQAAKSSIEAITTGGVAHRVGVISLPSFYEDFTARQTGKKDYKSATHDVARQLAEFKRDKVDSVLIDLRNNGGGSLTEAVELTGLFIGRAPVVQQRYANGKIAVEGDPYASIAWDGPLGVLINKGSASASEIFAAAIQDYGRGLIVGESSFGKGTVQTMINLDEVAKNAKSQFGELKMTVAQFFRVNGGTTQLRGVQPDIALPGFFEEEDFGESSFDNALAWSQIRPANYTSIDRVKLELPALVAKHSERILADKDFQYLEEDIAEFKRQRKNNEISLNESQRRKERDAKEALRASREANAAKPIQGDVLGQQPSSANIVETRDDGLQPDERSLTNELAAKSARMAEKDISLREAVHILSDEVGLLQVRPSFAATTKPLTALLSQ